MPQAEGTEQLQSAFIAAAPALGTTADVLTQLFDKSLPTMIGARCLDLAFAPPMSVSILVILVGTVPLRHCLRVERGAVAAAAFTT